MFSRLQVLSRLGKVITRDNVEGPLKTKGDTRILDLKAVCGLLKDPHLPLHFQHDYYNRNQSWS